MSLFSGKVLMITGGTGSFGNAVLERFLKTDIKEIRVFSRDEKKQDDMRHKYNDSKLKFYIGDVRDINTIRPAMIGVDYIFHAAALKQVPSCEFFPMEAVKTNVIGTDNVLTAAIDAGVGCVICLSTDKAAYPVNAMGISKALEERVAVAKSRTTETTKICCTRYVDDIVEGIKRVMQHAPEKQNGEDGLPLPPYAVYNIGNSNPENLLDFVTILQEELIRAKVLPSDYNFEAHKKLVPMQPGDVPVTYADTSALERDFDFKPSTSLRDGLRKFAEWYREFYKI